MSKQTEFGTLEERVAHFCQTTECEPPELEYEDGDVLLTEKLGDWVADNNASFDWVFCGDPATLITSFKNGRERGSEILDVFRDFEKELQPAFIAALRATALEGMPIDMAMKSFKQVVDEYRERAAA